MAIDHDGLEGLKQVGAVDTTSMLTPLEANFTDFYRRHHDAAMSHALRFVQYDDAEECVQKAAVWMWKNWTLLPLEKRNRNYFIGAVHHRAVDVCRSMTRESEALPEEDEEIVLPAQLIAPQRDESDEVDWSPLVDHLVSLMPVRRREVWTLVVEQHFSIEQAAEELDVAYTTITGQMLKARESLQKGLSQAGYSLSAGTLRQILPAHTDGGSHV